MRKLEGWSVPRDYLPQTLNTAIGTTFADAVEEYDAALRQFGQPTLEISFHRLASFPFIDVKQVNRAIAEHAACLLGRATEHLREASEATVVVRGEIREHLVQIRARTLIVLPGVDGVAAGCETFRYNRLAERGVGDSRVCSDFDENPWPRHTDQPVRERHMPEPIALPFEALGRPEQYVKLRRNQSLETRR
jgi:hypothetical protein